MIVWNGAAIHRQGGHARLGRGHGLLLEVVRGAGLNALRRVGGDVEEVAALDFAEALKDSRATVTPKMETEYKKMRGELKKRAAEVRPIGFLYEGMVESTRDEKHGPDTTG